MITFNKMGFKGRLGNQMFQYATLMGIANKLNLEFGIPFSNGSIHKWNEWTDEMIINKQTLTIDKCFDLKCADCTKIDFSNYSFYVERDLNYDENLFSIKDNTNIEGFFQNEKYFVHIKEEIEKQFKFKQDIVNVCSNFLKLYSDKEIVSIHIRLTDYYESWDSGHPKYLKDYIESIIEKYFYDKEKYLFLLFSDDVKYLSENFNRKNFLIPNFKNQFIDLCLMSMCNHNIIPNSTFSWWGAYLNKNPNKMVVGPKTWFNSEKTNYKEKFLLDDWISH